MVRWRGELQVRAGADAKHVLNQNEYYGEDGKNELRKYFVYFLHDHNKLLKVCGKRPKTYLCSNVTNLLQQYSMISHMFENI